MAEPTDKIPGAEASTAGASGRAPLVLIIEDGDEYLDNLSRFVEGPAWLQAHTGREALALLAARPVDLVYLDMRFDRIPRSDLLGDHREVCRQQGGQGERAWRVLANNQGLYILDAMRRAGFGQIPVILAYDFSRETQRLAHLRHVHPNLSWVPDAVTPEEVRRRIAAATGAVGGA